MGLTENPAALRRWMLSGPEMARVIGEFEASKLDRNEPDLRHRDQQPHVQLDFVRDVKSLTNSIEEMGSPFTDNSNDLLVLDTRNIVDAAVIYTVRHIEELGQQQYDTYVQDRLVNQTTSIAVPIKRNNLALFSRPPVREKSRSQLQLSSPEKMTALSSRDYTLPLRLEVEILTNSLSMKIMHILHPYHTLAA